MAFKLKRKESFNYESPQEMYKDYMSRKIKGPLDYQSAMIQQYMEKAYSESDVALELPTGSGKTLIGLLIGEYRRRKNYEKVLYLCPTNQLVNQTANTARDKYGIKVKEFTGKFSEYDPQSKAAYNRGKAIGITNYSSFFNNYSFFNDPDIIIMDDAHSGENYIASNWSLLVKRSEFSEMYRAIVEYLKDCMERPQYNRMINEEPTIDELQWFDKIPNIKLKDKIIGLSEIINSYTQNNNLKYSWANIKNYLHGCNIYVGWTEILIRPYIPPTLTHEAFKKATQRIYMSATLGESGELERIIGIPKIKRLEVVNDWDKKGIGRRFFVFPEAALKKDQIGEFIIKMNKLVNRSVVLVEDNNSVSKIEEFFKKNTDKKIFKSNDIEKSYDNFVNSSNGVAILANRFDGIDLSDDECRMLTIMNLPSATHLQEKFLITRMATSILFNERIKTRVVQAVGRCTRNTVDYAAVCIIGEPLINELVSPKKLSQYHPELQAEIEFGYDQSVEAKSTDDLIELLEIFYNKGEQWDEVEQELISMRDEKAELLSENPLKEDFQKLFKAAYYEVKFQYAIWREDYDYALECVTKLIDILDSKQLRGYRGYWYYMGANAAHSSYLNGNENAKAIVTQFLNSAASCSDSITWFRKLNINNLDSKNDNNTYFYDIVENLENELIKDGIKSNRKFEKRAKNILDLLSSFNGEDFERGYLELGRLLGYNADNPKDDGDPDTYWIINEDICIVTENKIYKKENHYIPLKDVRQALTHENWIKKNINILSDDSEIITLFITNTKYLEKSAKIHADQINYVNRDTIIDWARRAIDVIRNIRISFYECGNLIWRIEAEQKLKENKVTPKDFIDLIKKEKLSDLQTN